jgi:hypothetical protein
MINPAQFMKLLPRAVQWSQEQEQQILKNGIPLSSDQLRDANRIPLINPTQVRLFSVQKIPLPSDPELMFAAQAINLITPNTAGLCLRYGIFLRTDHWNNRELIVHELIHTSQYEKLGGHQEFLTQYLSECLQYQYPSNPLEQEAINKSKQVLRRFAPREPNVRPANFPR